MIFRVGSTIAILLLAVTANATPVEWNANGHTYDVITRPDRGPLTWEEAKALAEEMGGHLVTITSAAENRFVSRLVRRQGRGNRERYWLGGYQTEPGTAACEPDNCWAWVTGEEWSYANWEAGEPNNGAGGTQHYLHYWRTPGNFDDMENRRVMDSFVIEYAVPEPGTLLMLGMGLAGIGFRRRVKANA